jgi:hypothetical protein
MFVVPGLVNPQGTDVTSTFSPDLHLVELATNVNSTENQQKYQVLTKCPYVDDFLQIQSVWIC